MRNLAPLVSLAAVLASGMTARLETAKSWQLVDEGADLHFEVMNHGREAVTVAGALFSDTQVEISSSDGRWEPCPSSFRGLRSAFKPQWKTLRPSESMPLGLGEFSCYPGKPIPQDWREPTWLSIPGEYRLRVRVSHRFPSPEARSKVEVPADVFEGDLVSNEVKIKIVEPHGVDAEALACRRASGARSYEVVYRYPDSRYAALLLSRYLMGVAQRTPEEIKRLVERGQYPGWNSVPDASSPDGFRSISEGRDMATWQIEQGERILLEQVDFPYAPAVRLVVALDYDVLDRSEDAKRHFRALIKEKGSIESRWAARYMAIRGWR